MLDGTFRAIYGFVVFWPMVALCSRWRLKALPTAVVLTLYGVPVWFGYRVLGYLICG